MIREYLWSASFSLPLIRPSGTFSLEGEGFPWLFWNSGFCNSGQTLRAEWHEGGVRVEEETSSLKYAAINGMNRTASVQHSTNESIKNQCWWHQSTTNGRSLSSYCNINLQSIFKQYTKRQHPMNAKLTSVHSASISMLRVSIANAQNINQSINMQSIQCLLAKRTVPASNAHCVNNHWTQH